MLTQVLLQEVDEIVDLVMGNIFAEKSKQVESLSLPGLLFESGSFSPLNHVLFSTSLTEGFIDHHRQQQRNAVIEVSHLQSHGVKHFEDGIVEDVTVEVVSQGHPETTHDGVEHFGTNCLCDLTQATPGVLPFLDLPLLQQSAEFSNNFLELPQEGVER